MEIERNTGLITKEDLNFVKRLFLKNILWLILLPVLAGLFGLFYGFKQTKEYGASSQLLLNSSETYDYQEQINKNIGYHSLYSDITNQMRLIQSYDLVSEVLDSLDFGVSYFNEGKIRTTELYKQSPFKVIVEEAESSEFKKVYEKPIYLYILNENSFRLESEIGISGEYKFDENIPFKGSFIVIEKAYDFTEKGAEQMKGSTHYFVIHSKNNLINKYKSGITVENVEGTTILKASSKDRMQQKAAIFLDSLTTIYQRNSIKNESAVKERTLFYIKQQLDSTRVKLNQSQNQIRNYKDSASILNLEKEESIIFTRLINYESELKQEEILFLKT